MLNEYLASIPTAEQIASDPSGSRVPDLEMHLSELADELGVAARMEPEWQDRFLSYAGRMPDPWRTRLTLDLLAAGEQLRKTETRTRARGRKH